MESGGNVMDIGGPADLSEMTFEVNVVGGGIRLEDHRLGGLGVWHVNGYHYNVSVLIQVGQFPPNSDRGPRGHAFLKESSLVLKDPTITVYSITSWKSESSNHFSIRNTEFEDLIPVLS